jgi:hypothetical protein
MIKVHVWNYRGLTTAMGHASMHVGSQYISWWPEGDGRSPKVPGSVGQKVPLYSVPHIHGQSFDDDKLYEALDDNSVLNSARNEYIDQRTGRRVVPMSPDHTIELQGLDKHRLLTWWRMFNVDGRKWSTLGQNCATTVGRGLMIAGADDYAQGVSGWWHSWNTVWQPNDVLRYARDVHHGLVAKRGEHAAINFVRRFCKSPLGFTSITSKMDEKGLAEALYRELGTNTLLITSVFRELDSRRNTDADDVAEKYVNLLKEKKGSPLVAVAKDLRLKTLLVKVLSEGWTSEGEKKCIDFLMSLT